MNIVHELMPKPLPYASGVWCERCERWFGSRRTAATFTCETPTERVKLRQQHPPSPLEVCSCERRKARRDPDQPNKCETCGGDWLP